MTLSHTVTVFFPSFQCSSCLVTCTCAGMHPCPGSTRRSSAVSCK